MVVEVPPTPLVCLPDIIAHDKISLGFPLQVINNWNQRKPGKEGCATLEVNRQCLCDASVLPFVRIGCFSTFTVLCVHAVPLNFLPDV